MRIRNHTNVSVALRLGRAIPLPIFPHDLTRFRCDTDPQIRSEKNRVAGGHRPTCRWRTAGPSCRPRGNRSGRAPAAPHTGTRGQTRGQGGKWNGSTKVGSRNDLAGRGRATQARSGVTGAPHLHRRAVAAGGEVDQPCGYVGDVAAGRRLHRVFGEVAPAGEDATFHTCFTM